MLLTLEREVGVTECNVALAFFVFWDTTTVDERGDVRC